MCWADRQLSLTIYHDHITLLRVLKLVFELDLKNVRVLKLFCNSIPFCVDFFESPSSPTQEKGNQDKMLAERNQFMEKVRQFDPTNTFLWRTN